MSDDLDVAILAAQTNGAMNQIYKGQPPRGTRLDVRQYVHPSQQQRFQPPPPQNFNYPPQQNYGGHNTPDVDEYGLPRSIPASNVQLPMVIRGRDGQLIDLNQVISGEQPQQNYNPNVESFQGFQMPSYGEDDSKNSKGKHKQVEHPFETILKEIKSLKKSVNKLIREIESSKLPSPTKTQVLNEVTTKFANISEGISESSIGDQ
jgi:hypothetical protein